MNYAINPPHYPMVCIPSGQYRYDFLKRTKGKPNELSHFQNFEQFSGCISVVVDKAVQDYFIFLEYVEKGLALLDGT